MTAIFGVSMNVIMATLLVVFVVSIAIIFLLALRDRVMFRMGVRPITRRWGQTALIVVGVMLSTVIISATLATGDTISVSNRQGTFDSLKTIDEVIVPSVADAADSFGSSPFIEYGRFEQIRRDVAHLGAIDGLTSQLAVAAPAVNTRTRLNEGFLNVVGLEASLLEGFGPMRNVAGGEASIGSLGSREAFLNEVAARELDAEAGDRLDLYVEGESLAVTLRGIVEQGGLAGSEPTMVMPLSQVQEIFSREGEINAIIVSNEGDAVSGVERSREVTRELRSVLNDREVALRLKAILRQEPVVSAIQAGEGDLSADLRTSMVALRSELARDEFSAELNDLLSNEEVIEELAAVLNAGELEDARGEALTLFEELSEFRVIELKRDSLGTADQLGSLVTAFFLVMSLFSIAVGALLIFLIFFMLASARRPEMGMARAVGARRRHLIEMFTFEGTAYALVSAAVGVGVGLAVSALMVVVLNRVFGSFDDSFSLTFHVAPRSIVVAYCLGMVITVATVAVSAYRVSRLNIVAAVRNIPEAVEVASQPTLRQRGGALLRALARPGIFLWRDIGPIRPFHLRRLARRALLGLVWILPLFWPADILFALLRFIWPYVVAGWLMLFAGAGVMAYGIWGLERGAVFMAGASLTIIGLGLFLRMLAGRGMRLEVFGAILLAAGAGLLVYFVTLPDTLSIIVSAGLAAAGAAMLVPFVRGGVEPREDVRDRLAFTFLGLLMLALWIMPAAVWPDRIQQLEAEFDIMFVSGVFMVAAAVWTVMYNADLLLRALTAATSRFGTLRPVLVTAVAYPLSNKVRTGLTLAMFALVIFTLMVMSTLASIFSGQFNDPADVLGGWEVDGRVNAITPIEDIRQRIVDDPDLRIEDFEAIGGFTSIGAQTRQVGGESQAWEDAHLVGADDAYLGETGFTFRLIAEGYGQTARDVWQALIDDPSLAVVGGDLVKTFENEPVEQPDGPGEQDAVPVLQGVYYNDAGMETVQLEVRDPRTREVVTLTVIGVMDRLHRSAGSIITSKQVLDDASPFPVPITTYRFRLPDGIDAPAVSRAIEAAFLEHGMSSVVGAEELEREAGADRAFGRLFSGFMALGLIAGITALGIVSMRAVAERRQQIGVLRALGYRRRMVMLSFLLESSFVSLLGTLLGATLGLILARQAFIGFAAEEGVESLTFTIPWGEIALILVATYGFSMLATYLPARQASRTYPAEALRYE